MKVLRLKIYQPHAHYRIPFTFARRHTYPIPPYSTVIGLLCNVLGIRNHEDQNFQTLKEGLSLAIYGKFESMTREYVWFRNLALSGEAGHLARFGAPTNRVIDQIPEHPGGQMPTRIDVLEEVNLIIYIYHSDFNFLKEIENSLKNPEKRIYPLHLGRAEDWIVFDGQPDESIKIVEINQNNKKPFYGNFDYYTWIPDPKPRNGENGEYVDYIEKNFYSKNFERFFQKVKGSSHLITGFYKIENGVRNFKHIPVKLFEQGDFPFYFGKPFEFLIDEELNIPLFLCKMIY